MIRCTRWDGFMDKLLRRHSINELRAMVVTTSLAKWKAPSVYGWAGALREDYLGTHEGVKQKRRDVNAVAGRDTQIGIK